MLKDRDVHRVRTDPNRGDARARLLPPCPENRTMSGDGTPRATDAESGAIAIPTVLWAMSTGAWPFRRAIRTPLRETLMKWFPVRDMS